MTQLIFEKSRPGRRGVSLPKPEVPQRPIGDLLPPEVLRTDAPPLPEVSEVDVVRHYVGLSRLNHGVDNGFYPLGSCTMKYNPKVNEAVSSFPGFSRLHPFQPTSTVQGALELLFRLEQALNEIGGMAATTLQPAAGAHGEMTGLMIIEAYHRSRGEERDEVLIPDSAHGTNPASVTFCGLKAVQIPSNERGGVDIQALRAKVGPRTAALMLTNPNTLGLFEEDILEIAEIVHSAGGLLYYDGANANALVGRVRPGDMGFDVVHFNLHKTFSTPHGGGGPGAGPVGVTQALVPFLPLPRVIQVEGGYDWLREGAESIGSVKAFFGNFGVLVRAYAYVLSHGAAGLRSVADHAVLNANYLMALLRDAFDLPYDRVCMHEFVLSGKKQKAHGVRTLDMAKALLDYGFHAPTIYFPLVVEEALMIEPTETESKETLDAFAQAMLEISRKAVEDPESLRSAPHTLSVQRLDEARAARQTDLCWRGPQ